MAKLKVLYIIYLDKFAEGFSRFLRTQFPENESRFIIYGKKKQFMFEADSSNTVFLENHKLLNKNSDAYKWAEEADIIVFSGLFAGAEKCLMKFPRASVKKTYMHLWGGDFYDLRKKVPVYNIRQRLSDAVKKHYIKNAKGIINLISGEYEQLCEIVRVKGEHYIAPVCGGNNSDMCADKFRLDKSVSPVKICLGNSATSTNNHMEAIELLSRFRDEDIRVICPLSYGDKEYAQKVIAFGREKLGDRFEPITDYMDKDKYFDMLADCRVGIFNNDRQQAMGNISALIYMGAKIYIKKDTSMWDAYTKDRGCTVYDIADIAETDLNGFLSFSDDTAVSNRDNLRYYASNENHVKIWSSFFRSAANK